MWKTIIKIMVKSVDKIVFVVYNRGKIIKERINMTHEEEMAKLRVETAQLRAENDALQKKVENQLKDINNTIQGINNSLR